MTDWGSNWIFTLSLWISIFLDIVIFKMFFLAAPSVFCSRRGMLSGIVGIYDSVFTISEVWGTVPVHNPPELRSYIVQIYFFHLHWIFLWSSTHLIRRRVCTSSFYLFFFATKMERVNLKTLSFHVDSTYDSDQGCCDSQSGRVGGKRDINDLFPVCEVISDVNGIIACGKLLYWFSH